MDAEIYKNSIQQYKKSVPYKHAKNRIKQYYEYLCENLSKKEMSVLDKLISCYDAETEKENMLCFKAGLKTGFTVVKELE